MSHAVQINYAAIGIQCQSICDVAEKRLTDLERMIAEVEDTSKRLQNEQTTLLRRQIEKERAELEKRLHQVQKKAQEFIALGVQTGDSDYMYRQRREDIIAEANELQRYVNDLTSGRMVELHALYDSLLKDSIIRSQRALEDKANGVLHIDSAVQQLLDSIESITLRQFTYLAFLQHPELKGDLLRKAGLELMNEGVNGRIEKEVARIRAELEEARIAPEAVSKIVESGASVAEMQSAATSELVEESVRKKSLSIIKKAITARGFIIDKNNIKLKRDTNEVVMVALEPSGEKAEFRVFLDGKFIYDFHGYEGQACQKDIEPFMSDLEEVYGIHVTAQQEIWSNPDKISTMKYQAMNTNKNRG